MQMKMHKYLCMKIENNIWCFPTWRRSFVQLISMSNLWLGEKVSGMVPWSGIAIFVLLYNYQYRMYPCGTNFVNES